jgi:hypothetical protein
VGGGAGEEHVPLLCVVIDASGILGADASGLRVLRCIIDEHHRRSPPVEMMLASTKGPLRLSLRKAGIHELLGIDNTFVDLHDAVTAAERMVQHFLEGRRESCEDVEREDPHTDVRFIVRTSLDDSPDDHQNQQQQPAVDAADEHQPEDGEDCRHPTQM